MKHHKTILAALLLCSAILPAWGYQVGKVDIHGNFSQGYLITDSNNPYGKTTSGSFHMTEATVNASSWLNDKTRIGAQLYTFRLGDIGAMNMPQIDWAFIDYQANDNLGFRLGKIKIPSGMYGETLGLDITRCYAFLPGSVYRQSWRDFSGGMWGVGTYGVVPMKKAGSLDFNAVVGKVDIRGHSGINVNLSDMGPSKVDQTKNDYSAIGQVVWNTPVQGLRLGASLWYAHQVDFNGDFKTAGELGILPYPTSGLSGLGALMAGADTRLTMPNVYMLVIGPEYLYKDWTFAAEYMRMHTRMYTTVKHAAASMAPGGALLGRVGQSMNYEGLYFSAARQITPKLQLGAYYSLFFSNYNDRAGSDLAATGEPGYRAFQKDFAVSARYDLKPWWIVKAEGHVINGTGQILNFEDNPSASQDRYWLMGVLKTTLFF